MRGAGRGEEEKQEKTFTIHGSYGVINTVVVSGGGRRQYLETVYHVIQQGTTSLVLDFSLLVLHRA